MAKKKDTSLRPARFSDTGHRRRFVLVVHIRPDADAEAVHVAAGDAILAWVTDCIERNAPTITGTSGMSVAKLRTVDALARKGASTEIPVFEYEGVARVNDPRASEYDRDAFQLLREIFLILASRLGGTGGSITLGSREWVAEVTDGRLTLEETPEDHLSQGDTPRQPSPTL